MARRRSLKLPSAVRFPRRFGALPRLALPCLAVLCLTLLPGCADPQAEAQTTPPSSPAASVSQNSAAELRMLRGVAVSRALEKASAELAQGDLPAARATLDSLRGRASELSPQQRAAWTDLADRLAHPPPPAAKPRRTFRTLQDVQKLADAHDWTQAAEVVGLLESDPASPADQAAYTAWQKLLERRQSQFQDAQGAVSLLASTDAGQLLEARRRLRQTSEVAYPALIAGLNSDDPQVLHNVFRLLAERQQSALMSQAVWHVLNDPGRSSGWNAAADALECCPTAPLGNDLLSLALNSSHVEQRAAALRGLAQLDDPPPAALWSLTQSFDSQGPELAPALIAAARTALRHNLRDVSTLRGFPVDLSAESQAALQSLPKRLETWAQPPSADPPSDSSAEVRQAAQCLAYALGTLPAPPIKSAVVLGACGEAASYPVSGVFDGDVGDKQHEGRGTWRVGGHSRPWIVIDLGRSHRVAGVRIWNNALTHHRHEGWRDLEIYIDDHAQPRRFAASGSLSRVTESSHTLDYSQTVPVPLVSGRYVKLDALRLWHENKESGLTEIQILGF